MLSELGRYYKEQGIPALGFNCKHRAACSAMCAFEKMVSVPESYVGLEYETRTLPRLLFVSSDTNDAEWLKDNPEWGTLKSIRDITWRDRNKPHLQKPNSHWHQTILLAQAILNPFAKARQEATIALNDFVGHIAHARSTRCKDISIRTKEGNPHMSANCRGFLKGEIEIMRPDIIVTQGTRARDALWNVFPVIQKVPMPDNPHHKAFYEIVQLAENHTAIKIVAWHPNAHWKGNEKGKFIGWAAKSAQAFMPIG